jgi:hypothetical protein
MTNPLYEVIPAAARKYVYAVLTLAAIVFSVYQAADGDWVKMANGLIVALIGATAASNTNVV